MTRTFDSILIIEYKDSEVPPVVKTINKHPKAIKTFEIITYEDKN